MLVGFHRIALRLLVVTALVGFTLSTAQAAPRPFRVSPEKIELFENFGRAQIVVTQADAAGNTNDRSPDLSNEAKYASADPKIVAFDTRGRVVAVSNGQTTVSVTVDGVARAIPVTVTGVEAVPAIDFARHVRPVLNKVGCAFAACHASQFGKGGFKLSVFGFAPDDDRKAMALDWRQRRINLMEPEKSLLLRKATMEVGHGGGRRFKRDSVDYKVLLGWVQRGAPSPAKDPPEVTQITVFPSHILTHKGVQQQLRVVADYSDGAQRDVTHWAQFDSNDDALLEVNADGYTSVVGSGQAPIMVRYEGRAAMAMFVSPYADSAKLAGWKHNNFVDELASAKFRELGIEPSGLCDDPAFVRRAFLDAIGTLPTAEEAQAFIDSKDPDKRNKLLDRLLGLTGNPDLDTYNDQYAAYWTLKWSDLIRNDSKTVGEQGMWAMHNWIRESFRVGKPWDQFVRELVTAKGSIYMNGPANYFRINSKSTDLTESTAQIFMGLRMECAKCHHHPFERWSEADYYGFAAFFGRVGLKTSEEFGLFGREQVVVVRDSGSVRHPRTGKTMEPTPLGGEPSDHALDRRIPLAQWLTSPENTMFAESVVNRYVRYLLGRGLVEPVDDMRSTNPPTNEALMKALAADFVKNEHSLKHLIRTIMGSRLYQLSSQPTQSNVTDDRFYSHFKVKRLPAEPLLDAVDRTTGVQTKFKSLPSGTRAIELPDADYPNYFLVTFAKPRRASVCECERQPDENLSQALHTLNGDTLAKKLADKNGAVATLVTAKTPHAEIVKQLYLTALARYPSVEELEAADGFLAESPSPRECYEDLLWALINSKQFLFVR